MTGLRLALALGAVLATSVQANQAHLDELISELEALRVSQQVAAVGYALVERHGVVASGALGVTDWASQTPVDHQTMFKVGSVTKAFTGLALLLAEQRGELRLNDPLAARPAHAFFTNPWQEQAPITLAMLMEHSAGLTDMAMAEFDHQDATPIELDQALAVYPQSKVSRWRPGEHSSYSNSGSGLAAWALEQASGERYDDYLRKNLLQPLGMHRASTLRTPWIAEHLAQGYDHDHRTPIPYWHIIFRPAGALNARPAEMGRFVLFLLNEGVIDGRRLLPAEAMRRLVTPATTLAARAGLQFGYGLGVYARHYQGHVLFGHGGDGDGYLAHFAYSPDSGRGYFVVITAFDYGPLRRMQRLFDDFVVAPLAEPMVADSPCLDEAAVTDWLGEYQRASWRFGAGPGPERLHLSLEQGRLYTSQAAGKRRSLLPVSGNLFRRADETLATTALVRDAEGRPVIQGPMGNFVKLESAEQADRQTAPAQDSSISGR